MKRSPIKRGKPLSRGSKRLARGSKSLKRGGSLKRGSRMRQVGKRGRAISRALKAARLVVEERDGNVCARCASERCLPLELHHVVGRGRGGSHDPANLVLLGRACHRAVTDHTVPDWREWIASRKAGAA